MALAPHTVSLAEDALRDNHDSFTILRAGSRGKRKIVIRDITNAGLEEAKEAAKNVSDAGSLRLLCGAALSILEFARATR